MNTRLQFAEEQETAKSSPVAKKRQWLIALLFVTITLSVSFATPYLHAHRANFATEVPPAIADPEIGAGGGGNG